MNLQTILIVTATSPALLAYWKMGAAGGDTANPEN